MNRSRENTEKYMWYILKYHEEFNGVLSDEDVMSKMSYETGRVTMLEFKYYKDILKGLSKHDIDVVLMDLEQRGWI